MTTKKLLMRRTKVAGWAVVLWKMIDDCDYYDNVNDCADVDGLSNNDYQHCCYTVVGGVHVAAVVVAADDGGVMAVKMALMAVVVVGQVKIVGKHDGTIVETVVVSQSLIIDK